MKSYYLLFFVILFPFNLVAQNISEEKEEPEIGIIERLNTYIPQDIILISEQGDTLETADLLGKTTILSLVYYRCPGICTPLMDGLASVIKKSDLTIGIDYQVVTLSFNPKEGSTLAARKKKNYMNVLELEEVESGWIFYTSDSTNISRLTESVGFYYKQVGNDYTHAGTLIFMSPEGKITRYLNGTRFLPFEFKMAVLEASKGQSGPTINKVLQYCYSYDPEGQQYVLNITRVAGVIISFMLIVLFLILVIVSLKRRTKNSLT